jgi:two-component system CheB/CheR fusion protein
MKPRQKPSKARAKSALPNSGNGSAISAAEANPSALQIVGIGSSAGGVEALTQLFGALDANTGMAFVVVPHLDPNHDSMIADIIGRTTSMRARAAEQDVKVEPDNIYVLPPGSDMELLDGTLRLLPRRESKAPHRPIDHFLRSLAENDTHRAIGVILSGMGSDGSLGIEEIKAAGGLTFAQDNSAQQPSMPRSAIATGHVDMVLSPAEIARELSRLGKHPLMTRPAPPLTPPDEQFFEQIIAALREVVGVDFGQYKRNTLHRRILRRMLLHKYDDLKQYADHVRTNPREAEMLYQDVLISVTSFFRDPDAYEQLKSEVFPALADDRSRHEPVRVWAIGCSTGEEAYSIAIAYSEFAEASGQRVPIQIFATDLNAAAIEKARAGTYPKGIDQDVSAERLRRFFIDVDGSYRISKTIRDMCIFARQDVLADPPFSRMDLITCRNVMIYLDASLQQRLLPKLHYALRNHGYLWLGASETIGVYRDLFEQTDVKHKLYRKRPGERIPAHMFERPGLSATPPPSKSASLREAAGEQNREADRVLLARYAPPAVVLTRDLQILQYRGETGPYLAPAAGRASLNLLKMLREGLAPAVRRAVQKVLSSGLAVREDGLRVRANDGYQELGIEILPIRGINAPDTLLLLFHDKDAERAQERAAPLQPSIPADRNEAAHEIERLAQELATTRDYLQSVIEQQDASNEELQSANEEVQSANEELQSTNEELETSKEEIQATNEELETLNNELEARNLELSQINNDLVNLLGSAHMPIIILGRDLAIRRITPAAEKSLGVAPADVNRPIAHVKLSIDVPDLETMLLEVIDTVTTRERELQDKDGRWYLLRVRPYKTLDNRIDGAVLILNDIDAAKRAEKILLDESEARFAVLAERIPALIAVSGLQGLQYANPMFADFFGAAERENRQHDWTQFMYAEDRARYAAQYFDTCARHEDFEAQVRLRRSDGEYRWMKVVAQPRLAGAEFLGYVVCFFDIDDLKQAEDVLREDDSLKNRFIAVLGHELRNPLAAVRNSIEAINLSKRDASVMEGVIGVIDRQTANMVRIVDDLLDISRITHGMLVLHRKRLDVIAAVRSAIETTEHLRQARKQTMRVETPEPPIWMEADAVRIEQIFSNLLINASKFTGVGGNVCVFVSRSANTSETNAPDIVSVRIVDSGIGVDPKFIDRIFDLFVQADMSSSSRATGMGLGLPLTKQLVELHGGTITAKSDGEGKGLEIEVRLPIAAATA